MKKGLLLGIFIAVFFIGIVSVSALTIGYSFEHIPPATVSLNKGESKSYQYFFASGGHVRAQSNVTKKSGTLKIAYSACRRIAYITCPNLGTQTIQISSPGWVGGTWSNSGNNEHKFTYKVTSGSVTNMRVRMYDY